MRPLSRREGIWFAGTELDLTADVVYARELLDGSVIQADILASDTLIASELLAGNAVNTLGTETGVASDSVTGELTAPPVADTLAASDTLAVPVFLTSSTDTVAASDVLGYDDAAVTSESVTLTDVLTGSLAQVSTLDDTATASTTDAAVFSGVTSETVVASEAMASLDLPAEVVNTLSASETMAAGLAASQATTDTVLATDGLTSREWTAQTDTPVASDGLASVADATQQDTARVTDALTGALVVTSALSDGVTARDDLSYGYLGVTADTAQAGDSVAGTIAAASPTLADTAVVTDLLAGPVTVYAAALGDTATATDGLSGAVVLVGVLADTILAGDTLADEAYSVIVVTNAETGATSTYTMTPTVAGLAAYRGTLYLAGPDGLYAMDATEDPTGAVVWTLRTGFSNLGSDLLKRVCDVNVQGRTEGGLTVQAVVDRGGQKKEFPYLLPAATRDAYRDGVVKFGRGLRSVYWALGLQGEGPAEVDQLRVTVEPLSRRR